MCVRRCRCLYMCASVYAYGAGMYLYVSFAHILYERQSFECGVPIESPQRTTIRQHFPVPSRHFHSRHFHSRRCRLCRLCRRFSSYSNYSQLWRWPCPRLAPIHSHTVKSTLNKLTQKITLHAGHAHSRHRRPLDNSFPSAFAGVALYCLHACATQYLQQPQQQQQWMMIANSRWHHAGTWLQAASTISYHCMAGLSAAAIATAILAARTHNDTYKHIIHALTILE